jgi:hypothetical protein
VPNFDVSEKIAVARGSIALRDTLPLRDLVYEVDLLTVGKTAERDGIAERDC